MLIDLHAHAPHPGYYNQDPHWGPFFEQHQDGDIKLRVGDWVLGLGSPERKAAVRSGKGLKLEQYLARWADPKTRLAGMDAAGQNAQVVSVPGADGERPSRAALDQTTRISTDLCRPTGRRCT